MGGPPAPCVIEVAGDVVEIAASRRARLYEVRPLVDDAGEVLGYRFTRDDGEQHDVCTLPGHWGCSCGDHVYRRRTCKHMQVVERIRGAK